MTSPISVPAPALRDMLTAVLPHAAEDGDDTMPGFATVRFEVRDGTLYLIATDRYTIGVARHRIPGADAAPPPDQAALLPVESAHALHRMLEGKPAKGASVAAIIISDGKITVDAGPVMSWHTDGEREFPDWRGLLHPKLAAGSAELGDAFGLDPVLLARFAAGCGPHDQWAPKPLMLRVVQAGTGTPVVLVTKEDWFLGAVMPVRRNADTPDYIPPQWADWAAVVAVSETAGATA